MGSIKKFFYDLHTPPNSRSIANLTKIFQQLVLAAYAIVIIIIIFILGIMEVRGSCFKISFQNQFYYCNWLGIAKPKDIFKINLNSFTKFSQNFLLFE